MQYGIYNNSTITLENPNCWISSSNQYIMKTKSGPVKNDKVTVNWTKNTILNDWVSRHVQITNEYSFQIIFWNLKYYNLKIIWKDYSLVIWTCCDTQSFKIVFFVQFTVTLSFFTGPDFVFIMYWFEEDIQQFGFSKVNVELLYIPYCTYCIFHIARTSMIEN